MKNYSILSAILFFVVMCAGSALYADASCDSKPQPTIACEDGQEYRCISGDWKCDYILPRK